MKGKKTGGRTAGTPNKEKPLKSFLREHSTSYFTPNKTVTCEDGETRLVSQYDLDLMEMEPADRAKAELTLLKFHTPQMQATSVDMTVSEVNQSIVERLARLTQGEEM